MNLNSIDINGNVFEVDSYIENSTGQVRIQAKNLGDFDDIEAAFDNLSDGKIDLLDDNSDVLIRCENVELERLTREITSRDSNIIIMLGGVDDTEIVTTYQPTA